MSVTDISTAMSSSPSHVEKILSKKETISQQDLDNYLKSQDVKFWELAIEAIPACHMSNSLRKRVLLCKELSKYIKEKP